MPVSAAATACTGVTVRTRRRWPDAPRRGRRPSTAHAAGAAARSPPGAARSRQPTGLAVQRDLPGGNENNASVPSNPSTSSPSRGSPGRRSRTVVVVRSRPRLRGQSTSIPRRRSAATPSSRRLTSSSVSRVIWSGTARARSRSSTGHASAAARKAIEAWMRARSPKPCSSGAPVHSTAASTRCSGSCSSCTWSTSRTDPATSSSSSASTRRLSDTSWARVPAASGRRAASRRRPSAAAKAGPSGGTGADGAARGSTSATASRSPRTVVRASASSRPAPLAVPMIVATAASSSAARSATAQCGPPAPAAGRTLPAATSRRPSTVASASTRALGDRSVRAVARASNGTASRTGSVTVRRSSVTSTAPSLGGLPGRRRALPPSGSRRPPAAIRAATSVPIALDANAARRRLVPGVRRPVGSDGLQPRA